MKNFWKLTDKEKIDLQKQFVQDTNMIVDEASWDDKKGIENIVNKIFNS